MQKARGQAFPARRPGIALPLLVGTRFQVLFTPLTGVLFTFPSRYWFTIGRQVVFSLTRWSLWILAGFLVSRDTQVPVQQAKSLSSTGLSPSMADRSRSFD